MHKIRNLAAHPKLAGALAFAGAASVLTGQAGAVGQDYSDVTSGVTDNITSALTASLPAAGVILGVFVGFRVVKRVLR